MLVDLLAREAQTQVKRDECRALIGRAEIDKQNGRTGKAADLHEPERRGGEMPAPKPERSVERLIVISDDLALPFGNDPAQAARARTADRTGLRSIIDCLGTNEFIRLRIGIMPEHPISNAKNFVLENFSKGEQRKG